MDDLAGKGALVTGAASGIGLGMARALAAAGAHVLMTDYEEAALAEAHGALAATGAKVSKLRLDVSDRDAVYAAAEAARERLGRLHILCNNAGVGYEGVPADEIPDRDWDWVLGVNLFGVINGIRAFLPLIRDHGEGGHVVNTASIGGFQVRPGFSRGAYNTTKYAVVGLSEALAQDLAPHGIGVSVLAPAAVATSIYRPVRERPPHYGGTHEGRENPALRDAIAAGLDPDQVGRWVVRAIRDNQFYVFPHPQTRDWLDARQARIQAAYDWADRVRAEVSRG